MEACYEELEMLLRYPKNTVEINENAFAVVVNARH
jgi:hypothetical protein